MPRYDSIEPVVQLGDDLQYFSSNGTAWTRSAGPLFDTQYWDEAGADSREGLVDICIHQGEIHVVWVEPEWDGVKRVARGPFVKRWDGAAWQPVGGEIEPSLTPGDITEAWAYSRTWPYGVQGRTTPLQPAGSVYYPARPQIASDGTDLYVAYSVRVVDSAAASPPDGSYVPGQPTSPIDIVSGSEFSLWSTRWAKVRRWTGSDWELFGRVSPYTNNGKLARSTERTVGVYVGPRLFASPGEPGVCYLTVYESGIDNSVWTWKGPPVSTFLGIVFGTDYFASRVNRLAVARFDGTDVDSDIRDYVLGEEWGTVASSFGTLMTMFSPAYPFLLATVANDTGVGYVFWNDRVFHGGVRGPENANVPNDGLFFPWSDELLMTRFSDGATVQAYTLENSGTFRPEAVSHGDGVQYLYVPVEGRQREPGGPSPTGPEWSSAYLSVDEDAAADFQFLDGDSDIATAPGIIQANRDSLVADEPNDLWVVVGTRYGLYHRPCRGWTLYGYVADTSDLYLKPAFVRDGDSLYAAVASRGGVDLKIQVFEAPICRRCLSCGVEAVGLRVLTECITFPFANPHVQIDG